MRCREQVRLPGGSLFVTSMGFFCYFLLFFVVIPWAACQLEDFVSIDCGGTSNYTDTSTGLTWASDASFIKDGEIAEVRSSNVSKSQYNFRRDFHADNQKYCYSLSTTQRKRYIVRATFLYGSTETGDTSPRFMLFLDSTLWASISIGDASRIYVEEMILKAPSTKVDVCVCCASTGSPFISTLELRPLNGSMYATDFEDAFYLAVAARINFGALTTDTIRYPDDPYDRIWESDLNRRPNFLVGEAAGTQRISTNRSIRTGTREFPPEKVMQTAVVGTEGNLTYRLNLEGFPANARAFAYLAEIEDLGPNVTRKFRMIEPYVPGFSTAVVNIAENAGRSYSLYEPNSMNMTLEFVLSFAFSKTEDSTVGPLVNALEISRYVRIASKTDTNDVAVLDALRNMATPGAWVDDYGDPCNPIRWDWINCSNTSPPRITKIILSRKNLAGDIPPGIGLMESLTELWLDGNSLTGSIPDMSSLRSLTVVHLENNQLTGLLPSYFGDLPNLLELYIQNNSLSGEIPSSLLNGNMVFRYNENPWISQKRNNWRLIVGISVGAFLVFLLFVGSLLYIRYFHKKSASGSDQRKRRGDSSRFTSNRSNAHSAVKGASLFMDEAPDVAYFTVAEVEKMTKNYAMKIGRGSFGPVYHGKMKDGREVAIKHMADSSYHGAHQFENEVALLSRIHHRNLVPLIGCSDEGSQRNLVYEYMHNGSLRDHLHDPLKLKNLDWLTRLCIAEDAAKGLEYLHNGCNPSIIHRDVKTSNILLDINMRAKVSDFGLSRQTDESLTHISSVARGTVGYVDPEYYACQQLTEKSDVYSFGVVLLELISGRKPVSAEEYGAEWNIVHWARSYIRKGDINAIIHPSLQGKVEIESVWRVAEIAILSVEPHGASRPTMKEVVLAIQEAAAIEGRSRETSASDCSSRQPAQLQIHSNPLDLSVSAFDADSLLPSAR